MLMPHTLVPGTTRRRVVAVVRFAVVALLCLAALVSCVPIDAAETRTAGDNVYSESGSGATQHSVQSTLVSDGGRAAVKNSGPSSH